MSFDPSVDAATSKLLEARRVVSDLDFNPISLFVAVGYGADCSGTVPCPAGFDTTRWFAIERFISLERTTFTVQTNHAATGEGGLCFGDSGSPYFLGSSNVSVGATHLPNGNCNAAAAATRLDTTSARSFLGRFVELP